MQPPNCDMEWALGRSWGGGGGDDDDYCTPAVVGSRCIHENYNRKIARGDERKVQFGFCSSKALLGCTAAADAVATTTSAGHILYLCVVYRSDNGHMQYSLLMVVNCGAYLTNN